MNPQQIVDNPVGFVGVLDETSAAAEYWLFESGVRCGLLTRTGFSSEKGKKKD